MTIQNSPCLKTGKSDWSLWQYLKERKMGEGRWRRKTKAKRLWQRRHPHLHSQHNLFKLESNTTFSPLNKGLHYLPLSLCWGIYHRGASGCTVPVQGTAGLPLRPTTRSPSTFTWHPHQTKWTMHSSSSWRLTEQQPGRTPQKPSGVAGVLDIHPQALKTALLEPKSKSFLNFKQV